MTEPVQIIEKGYKVIAEGLIVTRALSLDEWKTLGKMLTEVSNRTQWAIGDWLIYGSGRGDYGEYYQDAQKITRRSFESLSQTARVSKNFPIGARAFALPWSHFREVLRLDDDKDRKMALRAAEMNSWTRDDLADFINGREREGSVSLAAFRDTDEPEAAQTRQQRRPANEWKRSRQHHDTIQCPKCGHKFERRGSKQAVA